MQSVSKCGAGAASIGPLEQKLSQKSGAHQRGAEIPVRAHMAKDDVW